MRNSACDQLEKSGQLERANEEAEDNLSQLCATYVGSASVVQLKCPTYLDSRPLMNGASVSIGIGKIVVEFFSAAISTSV